MRIQQWPRLQMVLKQFESGYERKTASVFSLEQLEQALQLPYNCSKWVLRKAALSLAFCGGLRCCELRSITFGRVTIEEEGIWVEFAQGKQRGEAKLNGYMVPFNRDEPSKCFATRVVNYLEKVRQSVPASNLKEEDAFFRRPLKSGYSKREVMGAKYLGKIGKNIASELGLPNPQKYTGHCFRRSAATAAANQGATTVDLKTTFGWTNEKTALKYIEGTKVQKRRMSKLLTGIDSEAKRVRTELDSEAKRVTTEADSSPKTTGGLEIKTGDEVMAESAGRVYKFNFNGSGNVTLNFH